MKMFRRLCSFVLVLSMVLSTGILEAVALSEELQNENLPHRNTTGTIADVSDLFVISETEPESEPEPEETAPQALEPVANTPVNAASAVTGEAQNFTYEVLENGTCGITSYTGDVWENLVIPETLDGYTVSAIGNHAFQKSSLVSVTLPGSVTTIGNYAFQKCANLASIDLGSGLTTIGAFAFESCTGLTGLVIPNTVASMGNGVFKDCTALTSITYPTSLKSVDSGFQSGVFSGCTALEVIEIPEGVTTIPSHVFGHAEHLKSVKLPSTLTAIGSHAFEYSGITAIDLPDGVTSLGNYAFQGCTALEGVEMGKSLISIGNFAFEGCSALTAMDLPDTVESIGGNAFGDCTALASFTYPKNLKTVGYGYQHGIFTGCTALHTIEVPEGVTTIADYAFYYARDLKSVKLPSTLTAVGNYAFNYSGITAIHLPDGVTSIGKYAFQGCTALEILELGNSLISIGSFAFGQCASLTGMDLPNTVQTIGNSAFKDCVKLESFTYPTSLKSVDPGYKSGILSGCTALESVVVPEGVTALPANVFYYGDYLKSVTIPSTLTSVGANAFSGCGQLTDVTLPDSVESIGAGAFSYCKSLTQFHYPANLQSVGHSTWLGIFTGCSALSTIEIPETVTVIPDYTFYYAESLKTVTVPAAVTAVGDSAFAYSGITAIHLPDVVKTIGDNAFSNCTALEVAEVGSSLTSVGASAFAECTSLTALDLPDTVESIGSGAFANCKKLAQFHYPTGLKTVGGIGVWTGLFTGCTALESVKVPEGVTQLPANIFSYAESLQSVSLPSTLTDIGSNAFLGTTFTNMKLPDGVTTIGNNVFKNCTGLKSVDLGSSLKTMGYDVFSGCTGLTAIDLPETVESIGSNAFSGCTGLVKMELPDALRSLGYAAFQNCTALESVVFCDEVTTLQGSVFDGCSSLRSVHLPRKLEQIFGYAFENCPALKELYVPNSVTSISSSAFSGDTDITFRCDVLSYAAEYAMDHQIPIIPVKISAEETDSLLNTQNSYYIHNYDGVSASGVMSMVVRYELRENANVTAKSVTVHVYDFAALRENSITLDGKVCTNYTYDTDTGRLTVPVEANSGTIRFCLKPLRYEALTSYARLTYTDSAGKEDMVLVGAVNSLMPVLNISAREVTATSSVFVSGLAVPEAEVALYLDGVHVKTVKANKIGDYSWDVPLSNPVDGKEYIIFAEAVDRDGNPVKAQTKVTYDYSVPELQSFVMMYDAHRKKKVSLLEMQGLRPVISFNPLEPFRFELDFTNDEILSEVYVVSTRNNVKKYLKAYWDEALGVFVAEGHFDPWNDYYVPGELSVEYVCGGERLSFSQDVEFGSQEAYDALPQVWKDAQIEVVENTQSSTVMNVTAGYGEEQISFRMSSAVQSIPQGLTEENIEAYGFMKLTDDYGKTLYVWEGPVQAAQMFSNDTESESGQKVTIVDFAADQISDITMDQIVDATGKALDIGTEVSLTFGALDIVDATLDYAETTETFDAMEQAYLEDDSKSASEKKHFSAQKEAAQDVNVTTTIVGCVYTVVSVGVGIAFPPAGAVLAVTGVLSGVLIAGIRAYVDYDMWDTVGDLQIKIRWSIDPSGYVYDETTGERLEDVTVHAYWVEYNEEDPDFWEHKPAEDEYGVLWDSLEYSQLNPLLTDPEGRYAWDVPEGWWRVSYEKEGYESTWSQWLPVPPPQTEVNIGMKPLAAAHTHTEQIIPAQAATCTASGLSEGVRCSSCQEILVAQQTIPATGHTAVPDAAQAATCTTAGKTSGSHCKTCGAVIMAQVAIPATGHSYDDNVDGSCNACGVNRADVETRQVVHMFRMYNPNTGEHFYTGSTEERDNLIGHGWQYEGVGFTFPANTGAPVHRLFQPSTGEHLYTMDEEEKDKLMAEGWNYEGIAFNSAYDTEAVQHRLHNPNATVGAYHFTFSLEEKQNLITAGWIYEGIGWYSCWK